MQMSRRPINPSRRASEAGKPAQFPFTVHSRPRSRSYLSIAVFILGAFLLIGYVYSRTGSHRSSTAFSWVQGDFLCHEEVQRTIPFLKEVYGDSIRKVLHIGPDTCSVVSILLREEGAEAWGVEPYDVEDADHACKHLVRQGIVRVIDIIFPLPYRAKSFSLVIVSDALDYLSPKYLNRTIPEMARISSTGLIIFTRYPQHHRPKSVDKDKSGHSFKRRNLTWWKTYFSELSIEENDASAEKFQKATKQMSYRPHCQIFHLKPYQ